MWSSARISIRPSSRKGREGGHRLPPRLNLDGCARPRQGPDGKRIRKWHSGFETEKDAKRAKRELLAAKDRAAYVAPSKRTTGAFLREDWLPGLRAQVRPGTWAEHKSKVEVHLVPAIGGVRLQ